MAATELTAKTRLSIVSNVPRVPSCETEQSSFERDPRGEKVLQIPAFLYLEALEHWATIGSVAAKCRNGANHNVS